MMKSFPKYRQLNMMDCGPSCLKIVSLYYGKVISIEKLRNYCNTTREGTSLSDLAQGAEKIGFRSRGLLLDIESLREEIELPVVVLWQQRHYLVVHKISKKFVFISDPMQGLMKLTWDEFHEGWCSDQSDKRGIALSLEKTPAFDDVEESRDSSLTKWRILKFELKKYPKFLFHLILGVVISTLLASLTPFINQSLVDVGILNKDFSLIYLLLFGQLVFFFGRIISQFIRSWILLHLTTRINVSLLAQFFQKLMSLPISYFDVRLTGDLKTRIDDHSRVEGLITIGTFDILFASFNTIIFSFILFLYEPKIFLIFVLGIVVYIVYIFSFLKYRKEIDYKQFGIISEEQSKTIEIINGMQDIKMMNAERHHRWKWEELRARLFKNQTRSLKIEQYQSIGSETIFELTQIAITFYAAKSVISGDLTIGMMLAIIFILGQITGPVKNIIVFLHTWQDAQLSMERIYEIHEKEGENSPQAQYVNSFDGNIMLDNVSFRYPGSSLDLFSGINLVIPKGGMVAVVGASGSGKTTLMKILLKFYEPNHGNVKVGGIPLAQISPAAWRDKVGVVMQEGYIFNDTIAGNICIDEDNMNLERLTYALEMVNLLELLKNLPLGLYTKIGNEGVNLSTGQKQRILLARAIYKNPDYLFLDEATSALDAENEYKIISNLNEFLKGKTSMIIAHRLSTVKNADQIIVLRDGEIKEVGTHGELVLKQGEYYNLVKNQLELEKLHA